MSLDGSEAFNCMCKGQMSIIDQGRASEAGTSAGHTFKFDFASGIAESIAKFRDFGPKTGHV